MSKPIRKFVAVFMLLWLPLSGGSALAASLAMQLHQGGCHESAEMMLMSPDDMGNHDMMPQDHESMQTSEESNNSSCTSCGVCHLACTTYLDVPTISMQLAEAGSQAVIFTPARFISHSSIPLVPPPLVAA